MRFLLILVIAMASYGQTLLSGVIGGNAATPTVSTPTFSQEGGSCSPTCSITVSDTNSGLSGFAMQYCTNTSSDCTPGTSYTGAVTISVNNTHLCALATATGYTQSATHCQPFTVGAAPSFVQSSSGDNSGVVTAVSSNAATTTAGDLLYAAWSSQIPACDTSVNPTPTDTGSDTFLPLPIPSGGRVLGVKITAAGSGYSSPSCSITGGGGSGATCSAGQTSGAVSSVLLTAVGSGYTGIPTITITDGGSGTGATASISAMGLAGGSVGCASHWYVKSAAGTSNNQVTITTSTAFGYSRLTVQEAANTNASAPFDVAFSATSGGSSVSSLTSDSFTTTSASEIIFSAATIEALSNTWTAGSSSACASGGGSCTIPSGSTPSTTAITGQYKVVSATQTGATVSLGSNNSAQMQFLGASFK